MPRCVNYKQVSNLPHIEDCFIGLSPLPFARIARYGRQGTFSVSIRGQQHNREFNTIGQARSFTQQVASNIYSSNQEWC